MVSSARRKEHHPFAVHSAEPSGPPRVYSAVAFMSAALRQCMRDPCGNECRWMRSESARRDQLHPTYGCQRHATDALAYTTTLGCGCHNRAMVGPTPIVHPYHRPVPPFRSIVPTRQSTRAARPLSHTQAHTITTYVPHTALAVGQTLTHEDSWLQNMPCCAIVSAPRTCAA